jgi:hypothetical protein
MGSQTCLTTLCHTPSAVSHSFTLRAYEFSPRLVDEEDLGVFLSTHGTAQTSEWQLALYRYSQIPHPHELAAGDLVRFCFSLYFSYCLYFTPFTLRAYEFSPRQCPHDSQRARHLCQR